MVFSPAKPARIGVLMRSFARTPDKVTSTVERVMVALKGLLHYSGDNWLVTTILVIIPTNNEYKDRDCGMLADELIKAWLELFSSLSDSEELPTVIIINEAEEDLFVGVQNLAATILTREECDIMVTLAPSAFRYFNKATADATMQAFIFEGAKIAGIKIPEDGVEEFVQRGTLGGPIACWDLSALIEAGGFNEAAAQPKIGEENPNAGCEEIHPIINIMRKYGTCLAPISLVDVNVERRVLEGEDLVRHQAQIKSKTRRQLAHAATFGVLDLEFFAQGVLPQYR